MTRVQTLPINPWGLELQYWGYHPGDRCFWDDAARNVEHVERGDEDVSNLATEMAQHSPRSAWLVTSEWCRDPVFARPIAGIALSAWGSA